jgi:CheY-like chemotaxis protein
MELENHPFNVRDCLDSSLEMLAVRADEKGLELLCDVDPAIPALMTGDRSRLRQIILNLAGNAIKFTSAGEISLVAEIEQRHDRGSMLRFTISDSGIGIPASQLAHIFEPFTQADSSTTRNYGGTGLGLTISTRLAQAMGGTTSVVSEVGRGSRFSFTAFLGDAEAPREEAQSLERLLNRKVLIVDDNKTNRSILERLLGRWGMRVDTAASSEEGFTALKTAHQLGDPYCLMLADMHLAGVDGFALIERLGENEELSTPTIAMLTSAGRRGDVARCGELGVAAYLFKPIRESSLRAAALRIVGGGRGESAAGDSVKVGGPAILQTMRGPLNILVADDNRINQKVALRLLEKRGHKVTLAADGREVLAVLETQSFDLILMDVQMPRMSGVDATIEIRRREQKTGRHVPIYAMTANAMKGDRERYVSGGMDGYLAKPMQLDELDQLLSESAARTSLPIT